MAMPNVSTEPITKAPWLTADIDSVPREPDGTIDYTRLPYLAEVKFVILGGRTYPVNFDRIDCVHVGSFYNLCAKECIGVNNCSGGHPLMLCPNEKCDLCSEPGHWDFLCPNTQHTDEFNLQTINFSRTGWAEHYKQVDRAHDEMIKLVANCKTRQMNEQSAGDQSHAEWLTALNVQENRIEQERLAEPKATAEEDAEDDQFPEFYVEDRDERANRELRESWRKPHLEQWQEDELQERLAEEKFEREVEEEYERREEARRKKEFLEAEARQLELERLADEEYEFNVLKRREEYDRTAAGTSAAVVESASEADV